MPYEETQVPATIAILDHGFVRLVDHMGDDLSVERGWPRELARCVLPVATYSHMFATVNLLNLMRFLTLRCDAHAQHEIRVYADALRTLAYEVAPVCMAAWKDKADE